LPSLEIGCRLDAAATSRARRARGDDPWSYRRRRSPAGTRLILPPAVPILFTSVCPDVPPSPDSDDCPADDPEAALREVRGDFIRAFPGQITFAGVLAAAAADPRQSKPLIHLVHQMAGLAGTVGFPAVSKLVIALEQRLSDRSHSVSEAFWIQPVLDAILPAFDDDLLNPPDWADAPAVRRAAKVLIAEADPLQQTAIAAWLAHAGYTTVIVASGDQVLRVTRQEQPGLVLLDIDLPVADGYRVFWDLKASPDVAAIPVMFMSARVGVDNRLTGLAMGADDYLEKPLDPRELLLRMSRVLNRAVSGVPRSALLAYDAFQLAAERLLQTGDAAIVVVRLPPQRLDDVRAAFLSEARKCDLVGRYDADHLVLAMPDLEPALACVRVRETIARLGAWAPAGLTAGVASASTGGDRRLVARVVEAQSALARARMANVTTAMKADRIHAGTGRPPTVVFADEDPQIISIVAPRMRAAGYHTVLAFDGQQALDAVRTHKADLLVIDLAMPKVSGFAVLERLRRNPVRPITMVLSGDRQSDDVGRATMLGACDYILKPFEPDDLMARVARQLAASKALGRSRGEQAASR
jgi:DNA-binding response OmpR family regulator